MGCRRQSTPGATLGRVTPIVIKITKIRVFRNTERDNLQQNAILKWSEISKGRTKKLENKNITIVRNKKLFFLNSKWTNETDYLKSQ